MKKLTFVFMLLVMMLATVQVSAKKKETFPCKVVLTDGKVVKGVFIDAKTKKIGSYQGYVTVSIDVAPTADGKVTTYQAADIKDLYCGEGKNQNHYVSCFSLKNFTLPKNLRSSGKKYLFQVVYEGKKALGLGCMGTETFASQRFGGGISFDSHSIPVLLFVDKSNGIAIPYYEASRGIQLGVKADLKRNFAHYPKMVEYLDNDFKVKMLKDDPDILIKKLNALM